MRGMLSWVAPLTLNAWELVRPDCLDSGFLTILQQYQNDYPQIRELQRFSD